MTMNTVFKKIVCGVLSLAIIAGSLFTGANSGFTKTGGSTIITASADKASDIVDVAKKYSGKTQSQMGYTSAWCAWFISDIAKEAGFSYAIPRYGYCPDLYNAVIKAGGEVVETPKKGDLVFYKCNKCGRFVHVSLMIDSKNTIHGNYGYDPKKPNKSYSHVQIMPDSSAFVDCKWHTVSKKVYVRPAYKKTAIKTDKIIDGRIYTISPIANTGINIVATGNSNKSNVKLATSNAKDSKQQWKVIVESNGYIRLQNVYSKKYLDVAINNTSNCANEKNIHLYSRQSDKNTSKTQMFAYKLMKNDNTTYYKLTIYNTKYSVDAASDAPKNGSNLQTWKWLGNTTQQWVFKRIK